MSQKAAQEVNSNVQNRLIADVAKVVYEDVKNVLIPYAGGYIGGGLLGMLGGKVLMKRRDEAKSKSSEQYNHDILPKPEEEQAVNAPEEDKRPKPESKPESTTKK